MSLRRPHLLGFQGDPVTNQSDPGQCRGKRKISIPADSLTQAMATDLFGCVSNSNGYVQTRRDPIFIVCKWVCSEGHRRGLCCRQGSELSTPATGWECCMVSRSSEDHVHQVTWTPVVICSCSTKVRSPERVPVTEGQYISRQHARPRQSSDKLQKVS